MRPTTPCKPGWIAWRTSGRRRETGSPIIRPKTHWPRRGLCTRRRIPFLGRRPGDPRVEEPAACESRVTRLRGGLEAFRPTIGQTMVLHGLHLVRPHGEPRHSQGRNVRRELPAGWIRDLSVDPILARGTKTFAKSADVSGTARYRVTSRGKRIAESPKGEEDAIEEIL